MKTKPLSDNSFVATLNEIQNGGCVTSLSEEMRSLIEEVKSRNAAGEITLKLRLKAASGGEQIIITPVITVKRPKPVERGTIFYPTDENILQRNDPNQRQFDLREVPRDEAQARELPEEKRAAQRAV